MKIVESLVVALTLCAGGCGDHGAVSTPTPTTSVVPVRTVTGTIAAFVYDTASRRLQGAVVEVVDGPATGLLATSDERGYLSMSGTFVVGPVTLRVSKQGYQTTVVKPTVPSDPALSYPLTLTLRSLATPINLAGKYTLTFKADQGCSSDLPDEFRTRTYSATIAPRNALADTFGVTLAASSLINTELGLAVSGDYVYLLIDPEFGGGLTERLAADRYFQLYGSASGTGRPSGTWSIVFNGVFDYCEVNAGAQSSPWVCTVSNRTHQSCPSRQHELVFVKQ